ncbi:peptidylprolyl isomerase [Stakelama saccharophila]|uniref:Parvulin-like PPIase n=1 Tax=Stakelama saccharophila TaxID=3075605 RepID=A0ABZ0B5C2_9SPHN|nr:SurA N-terminal domain-containing protein [Stakelama sp. W311]WNO52582.1 SurA N-terminal domain-containing protein [Stakelama sp. W311]
MLSFIRRLTKSRLGVIVTLIVLVVIALAFAAGDISSFGPASGGDPNSVAVVGDTTVGQAELRDRAQLAVDRIRQQQPQANLSEFAAQGGLGDVLNQIINGVALEQFGHASGMVVSKKLIDGQIASFPAFQGLDGKFDQEQFNRVLATQGVTADQIRADIRRQTLAQWLMTPTLEASYVPQQVALPYASLLLEKRHGAIAFLPTRSVDPGDEPDDGELKKYYQSHVARYTVPERRVIRYATVAPDDVADRATPTDAEIAQAYRAAGTRYAAKQQRSVQQLVVADAKQAQAVAKKIAAGTSVSAAADSIGLEATTIADVTREALADRTSDDFAKAVFSARDQAVVGPVQSALGYYVGKVTDISQVPGKTLAQATPEIAEKLKQQKLRDIINALQDKLDSGITDGATFAELVKENQLDAKQTAPVLPTGVDPEHPENKPDPALSRVVEAGFAAMQGDAPQLVQLNDDGTFALVALGRVVPKAAKSLDEIHDAVVRDYMVDQAKSKARALAQKAVDKVNKGTSLGQAIADTGVRAPAPEQVDATRADLARNRQQVPPPIALMFSMDEGQAKLLEAPNNSGWFVIHLDQVDKGDASDDADLVKQTRQGLGGVVGEEYAEQFAKAVRLGIGVKRNEDALAKLRTELGGGATP